MPASINVKHIGKASLALGIALFFLSLYLNAAQQQSLVNSARTSNDQGQYRKFAISAYKSNFQYTGNRNRMPLYPWIQALFYSPEMDTEAFFQQGKQRNIALSLICLLALGIAFFAKFSKIYAFYSILVIAFLAFAIKSPWFQTEILFYTLFGFAFMLSLETLTAPKWYKSIGVGVLFALAHFSKASAMPGLFIFISSYGILFLHKLFSRSLSREQVGQILYYALAPLAVFMVLLFPYFQESKARYGAYFYNVNTTFYMWYDSWDEARYGTIQAGDDSSWPDMPDEEIPSLSKYLNEHSSDEIIDRFRRGLAQIIELGCSSDSKYRYGYCSQVRLNLIILAGGGGGLLMLILKGSQLQSWLQSSAKHIHTVWYILLFFVLYALSFAWYMPIIIEGVRTILTLLIPLLWTIGLAVHLPQIQSLQFTWLRRQVKVFHIVYLLMTLTVFYEIYQVIAFRAAAMYGGK